MLQFPEVSKRELETLRLDESRLMQCEPHNYYLVEELAKKLRIEVAIYEGCLLVPSIRITVHMLVVTRTS